MNTKILQKCLEELKKDTPDLSYLRGTLETLIEMAGGSVISGNIGSVIGGGMGGSGSGIIYTTTGKDLLGKTDEILTDEDKAYAAKMVGGPIAKLD